MCNYPLHGFVIGETVNGKRQYKICSRYTHHIEFYSGSWHPVFDDFVSPYAEKVLKSYDEIPCGKCIDCRLKYSRDWANRCMLELQYHKSAYFVTLTYSDENIPVNPYGDVDVDTGETCLSASLKKSDLQKFFKRLRKNFPDSNIRYYACGEYGDNTHRPHYHAIIYGLELNDLVPYKRSEQGYQYYNSETLQNIWNLGYVVVGEVTWETCAYTARYVMKKLYGKMASFYEEFNLEPEFTCMSLKPAIGKQWFLDHKDHLYDYEYINISTPQGGKKFKPPRYYDKLFDIDNPLEMSNIKDVRKKVAVHNFANKLRNTSLDEIAYQDVEEFVANERVKKLSRNSF